MGAKIAIIMQLQVKTEFSEAHKVKAPGVNCNSRRHTQTNRVSDQITAWKIILYSKLKTLLATSKCNFSLQGFKFIPQSQCDASVWCAASNGTCGRT